MGLKQWFLTWEHASPERQHHIIGGQALSEVQLRTHTGNERLNYEI